MSVSTPHPIRDRLAEEFTLDRQAVLLAALAVLTSLLATLTALRLQAAGVAFELPQQASEVAGSEQAGQAAAGSAWALLEVLGAVVLLAVLYLLRLSPALAKKLLKYNLAFILVFTLGADAASTAVVAPVLGVYVAGLSVYIAASHYDLWWAVNNVLVVTIAVFFGAAVGLLFGLWGMVPALVLFAVYDHYFANKRGWMFDFAQVLLRYRLPVLFFKPDGWRLNWDDMVAEPDDDDGHADSVWGIGMADLALPAGLAAAVATAGGPAPLLAAGGVVAGIAVACFRLRHRMLTAGSGAGMPALTAGAIGGWLLVAAPLVAASVVGVPA